MFGICLINSIEIFIIMKLTVAEDHSPFPLDYSPADC